MMGEMADYALEGVMDDEDARLNFRIGKMSHIEAYDRGIIDELGREPHEIRISPKRCRYCGKRDLVWVFTNNHGWRLHDGPKAHECPEYVKANGTASA